MSEFENTPPLHVLLPTCNETSIDVFLEILKSVVLHTRLHDNIHINSMISVMTGETLVVDKDDLLVDWKNATSNLRQIRQSKLLGFWAARHYPLIGKKLLGAAWQPPEEFNVQVNEMIEITEGEIDSIISKKIKLRIIELNVCKGTSKKLNYFVRVPMSVGKVKRTILSSKMTAFDIENEYLSECWKALQLGGFASNFENQINSTATFRAPQPLIATSHLTSEIIRNGDRPLAEKRNSRPTTSSDSSSSSSQIVSPCNVLLTDISMSTVKNDVVNKPKTIQTAKRARCVIPNISAEAIMHDERNIDALRLTVCELRKDIHNLTKSIGHNAAENETNSSERFHLTVFKQKDSVIFELTESFQRSEKQNELLKAEITQLRCEIEAKSTLIRTLEKVVEANSKLQGKMEDESNAMAQKCADADKLKSVVTETNNKLQEELATVKRRFASIDLVLQNEKQDLIQQLSAGNQLNCELAETNGLLRQELNAAINHSANLESNLKDLQNSPISDVHNVKLYKTNDKQSDHLTNLKSNLDGTIEELHHKLSAADKRNIELTEANIKIQQDLNEMKDHLANTESKSHRQIQDLVVKLAAADQRNIELTNTNVKIQHELNANSHLANLKSNLDGTIEELHHKLSAADKRNIELTEVNIKIQQDLNEMKDHLANTESKSHRQIQDLAVKLSAADQRNIELTNTNVKIQHELNANSHLANLKSNLDGTIEELHHKLSAADKRNIELTEVNIKIQQDLNEMKDHLANTESKSHRQIQDLAVKLSAADQRNIELTNTNVKIQHELNVNSHLANLKSNLDGTIEELHHKLSAADKRNIELTEVNIKIQQDLNEMKDHLANTESKSHRQIQDLAVKLSAADQRNIELTDTNVKIQHELELAKIELKKNENLSVTLNNLKARTNMLIGEFENRVKETENINAQLALKNEKLQEELYVMKQNANDDKVLLLLPNRPGTHVQTERKHVSVHEQVESEESNIQSIGIVDDNYEKKLAKSTNGSSNKGHNIIPYGDLNTDTGRNDLLPEPMKSGGYEMEEAQNGVCNVNNTFLWTEEFVSVDPIVEQCRPVLQQQRFGWMKFQPYKSTKFCPAFVYPVDDDGLERAQKIKGDGYITDTKSPFWEFHFAWDLPNDKKHNSEVSALKKFNKRFGSNFQ